MSGLGGEEPKEIVKRRTEGNHAIEIWRKDCRARKKVLQAWWYSCVEMKRQRSTSLEKNYEALQREKRKKIVMPM
jgi:hypothetical protein